MLHVFLPVLCISPSRRSFARSYVNYPYTHFRKQKKTIVQHTIMYDREKKWMEKNRKRSHSINELLIAFNECVLQWLLTSLSTSFAWNSYCHSTSGIVQTFANKQTLPNGNCEHVPLYSSTWDGATFHSILI